MKVSVLVCVYNGEKFLQKCLDSLNRQTHRDIEIMCINDGSTDRTLSLMQRQKMMDERIRIVDLHSNLGLAKAQNVGISKCTGDIIAYLDCDDWMADDSIEKLVRVFEKHEDADCVLLDCKIVSPDGKQSDYGRLQFNSLSGYDAFVESLTWNIHGVYAARKWLYDKVKVDDTCKHFSNDNTTRLHYILSRKVYSSSACYYYLQNPEAISHQVSIRRIDYMEATRSMKRQLEDLGCSREIMSIYEGEKWKVLIGTYKFYWMYRNRFSKAERKLILDEIRRGWGELDLNLISPVELKKRGQRPFTGHWLLFRLQQEVLFTLRKLAGRL